jgi:hypothetical protein
MMQYKLQVRNFIFVVLSLALLVGLASSVAAETLDTEGRWYQQQVTVTPQVQCTPVTYTATCVPKQACVQYTTQQVCEKKQTVCQQVQQVQQVQKTVIPVKKTVMPMKKQPMYRWYQYEQVQATATPTPICTQVCQYANVQVCAAYEQYEVCKVCTQQYEEVQKCQQQYQQQYQQMYRWYQQVQVTQCPVECQAGQVQCQYVKQVISTPKVPLTKLPPPPPPSVTPVPTVIPTAIPTTVIPTVIPTTVIPTVIPTTVIPTIVPTTVIPTVVSTTITTAPTTSVLPSASPL